LEISKFFSSLPLLPPSSSIIFKLFQTSIRRAKLPHRLIFVDDDELVGDEDAWYLFGSGAAY
jgi:hypothetical protein